MHSQGKTQIRLFGGIYANSITAVGKITTYNKGTKTTSEKLELENEKKELLSLTKRMLMLSFISPVSLNMKQAKLQVKPTYI